MLRAEITPVQSLDALLPPEMARRAEAVGAAKAAMDSGRLATLGVLAGAFIALGAIFSTVALAGGDGAPWGPTRVLAGVVFSVGLVLVVVGGAELFTGNSLIVMAWAGRRVGTRAVLRNWTIVYAGNFAGALGVAIAACVARLHDSGAGTVGAAALRIATAKVQLGFEQAVALGVLCNLLVSLAVWLSYSARSTTDRVIAVVPPIAAFVAAGFEHSVANMYFVPFALMLRH
jgi:formate transporter